jgi:hypothetical protein
MLRPLLLRRLAYDRSGRKVADPTWLPFWMGRLDEHMEAIRSALHPELKYHSSEYIMGGRYYRNIEVSEEAKVTNMVTDIVGDHVLMYASDYPHGEGAFPELVNIVRGRKTMSEERKRKLFWEYPVRCYARRGLDQSLA